MKDDSAVHFNESKYGVSCEVQFNKNTTLAYLLGKNKYLSLPDKNYNVKNCQGHMVSGTSTASIGYFMVDTWMLKLIFLKSFVALRIGLVMPLCCVWRYQ